MAKPRPSKPGGPFASHGGQKPKGRPIKMIEKTADLLLANAKQTKKGNKGKEKEVLGHLAAGLEERIILPGGIQVERFAKARALEILALQNAIKTAAALGSTRAFQSLPRHLRRRAASHNPRRVPKRYRSRAAAEIQPGDNIAKLHRKRAKLRAKGNLKGQSRTEQLLERQRTKTWLPTHIWHAKRFHMMNIWGYRLPRTPTLKSFRPAYRAAARKAIVNDVSYYGTLELTGSRDDLIRLLARVIVGQFAGSRYESGARAAQALAYADGTYPHGLIGPVELIWQPTRDDQSQRTIWIRIHPSINSDIYDLLVSLLSTPDFQERVASSSTSVPNPLVQLRDLHGEIDSFEILGPKAARILRRILRLVKSETKEKTQFFDSLSAVQAGEIADGLIAGFLVHDPRLIFPAPMLPSYIHETDNDGVLRSAAPSQGSSSLAESSIWDAEVREELSTPRYKKSDLDRRRQKLGLPGTQLRPTPSDNRVPLLLIQGSLTNPSTPSTPGSDTRPISGFTLLVPRGWSMYLLSAFAYAGCMIGGLVERRNMHREAGIPSFPEHYGDVCQAGSEWERTKADEEKARWDKKPPAKRPQFSAKGTTNPWIPNWREMLIPHDEESMLNAGQAGAEASAPTRPWLFTGPIRRYINALHGRGPEPQDTLMTVINAFREQRSMPTLPPSSADSLYSSALVHVRLEVECRGSPGDMAIIYALPLDERQRWLDAKDDDSKYGRAAWDLDEPKREMQKLGEVVPDPSRTIGYTSTGNYSLSRGHGFGLATISLKGYVESAKISGPEGVLVKVKNRDGRICRLARVELV